MEIIKLKETSTSPRNNEILNQGGIKITDLKQAVKNPNRVNVYVNDKYEFSLDVAQLVDFKLKVGKTITKTQLKEFKKASEFGKLYQRTLEWVLMRPRSIKETRDYLYKKTHQKKLIKNSDTRELKPAINLPEKDLTSFTEEIIARLISKHYLDDLKFARYYVENRFVKKGVSKKRLRMELIKKGISSDIIGQVISGRTDEEEIRKIIARKRTRYDDQKLIAYLCRQGFDYQLAQSLVQESA